MVTKIKVRSKKAEYKELDQIWKDKVKERDNWTCQVCGKRVEGRNCNAHHILPRQLKGLRWDVRNGITLCYQHKVGIYSPHQNAIWFFGWMNQNKHEQLKFCISKIESKEKLLK